MAAASKKNQQEFAEPRVAEDENGSEVEKKEKEAVLQLRQLLKEETKLNPRTDEEFLLRFVRVRKGDVDAARRTVRNYYKNRASYPQFYSNFVPSSINSETRRTMTILPSKDVLGRPVLLHKPGLLPLDRDAYDMGQKALFICIERIAADPVSQTTGISFIVDSAGFSLDRLFYCNLNNIRRTLEYLQDCMPIRLKALHIVHESKAIDFLYGILRPFLRRKLTERLHFHGSNYENLLSEIPPQTLPKECGGEADNLDFEGFWRQLDQEEVLFVDNNRFGYVEDNAPHSVQR
ncbi:alpha-tocopherol transfer protein-like isoform X1 [Rhipicephalus microplus]|uniref:alpha-tocopherol transfer protein-like isoform X1 n=1 Tax=Rhipicephalus microplus TaxID=6941 RepID=UPI003F6B7BDA